MPHPTSRDLVIHAMQRCVDAVGQAIQLADTPEEAATIALSCSISLLGSCAGLVERVFPSYESLTEAQQVIVLSAVASAVLASGEKIPDKEDMHNRMVLTLIREVHRMLARELPHGFEQDVVRQR